MATRSKVGSSSRRPSFRDQADLQDIFASDGDESEGENKEPLSAPETKRARRASNPSTSRPYLLTNTVKSPQAHVRATKKQDIGSSSTLTERHGDLSTFGAKGPATSIYKRKIPASSTIQEPASISTAKHILGSLWHPKKDRAITSGQAIRSKAVQAYGARNSTSSLTTDKHLTAVQAQPASPRVIPRAQHQPQIPSQPSPPQTVSATAPASQFQERSLATLPPRVTLSTSLATRALVGLTGPEVAGFRAPETEPIIHEDTSLESLEGPNIMTPRITHVDPPVPPFDERLASPGKDTEREESPDLGSESSYYDRSLYGPSSPPCIPGNGQRSVYGAQSDHGCQSANDGQSVKGGHSVDGGPSVHGARSVYEDLDPDALDDEEFDMLVYGERTGERTEERTQTESGEMYPMEESSDAEAMDICSEDGEGPAYGDPVQQWRADVV